MRHALEEIALSVGEVVHRIRFPRRARTMVRMVNHPIDDRIAEVHVRVCHVDLARSTMAPSAISPVFIFLKRARLSSIGRLRYGLSMPGCVGVPFAGLFVRMSARQYMLYLPQ